MTTPTTSITKPYFIIWLTEILPDAKTTAFGGVEMGSMVATEAAIPAERTGNVGSVPAVRATERMIGIAMLLAAVFEITSDRATVKPADAYDSSATLLAGTMRMIDNPMIRASPVGKRQGAHHQLGRCTVVARTLW